MSKIQEVSVADLRDRMGDVLHQVAVAGQTFYVTRRGRRIATLSPIPYPDPGDGQ